MKLQNTNTKEFKKRMFAYLIESAYDVDDMSEKEIVEHMYHRFVKEYCYEYNIKRYPNETRRLEEYLKGLPFNIAYMNDDILRTLETLHELPSGSLPHDAARSIYSIENWFHFCAFKMLQMVKHYEIKQ